MPSEIISEAQNVQSWTLPNMGDQGRVVRNESKKKQNKRQQNEVVEDYHGEVKSSPITAEQLQEITEQAHKEGFEQGYREGLTKGSTEGQAQGLKRGEEQAYNEHGTRLQDEIKRVSNFAESLFQPMLAQENQLENVLMDLVVNLAQHLLRTEVDEHPEKLLQLVQYTLEALPVGAKNISVSLNSDDAELVERLLPPAARNWIVNVDPQLQRGGCTVKTSESFIDFSVEKRLAEFLSRAQQSSAVESEIEEIPDRVAQAQSQSNEDRGSKIEALVQDEEPITTDIESNLDIASGEFSKPESSEEKTQNEKE